MALADPAVPQATIRVGESQRHFQCRLQQGVCDLFRVSVGGTSNLRVSKRVLQQAVPFKCLVVTAVQAACWSHTLVVGFHSLRQACCSRCVV
jgi:hypothetical protein